VVDTRTANIKSALALLCVDRFVLAIHDQSFPSDPDEESGRGTPYGKGGWAFLDFVARLGFNVIQLGPQGLTSRTDPSPYNGSIFAKDPLSLAPHSLSREGVAEGLSTLDDAGELTRKAAAGSGERVDYAAAWRFTDALLDKAGLRLAALRDRGAPAATEFERFRKALRGEAVNWFERDTAYEILSSIAGTDDWRRWGPPPTTPVDQCLFSPPRNLDAQARRRRQELPARYPDVADRYALAQYLLHVQHDSFRKRLKSLGLLLYGDAQIGFSHRDRWAWRSLFLDGYFMGAPPSRSNPEGQPWGYPLLNPDLMHPGGVGLELVKARFGKLLADYDGLRIDHPHGLVCPWVYRSSDPDPIHAVQSGARLNCTPGLADHTELVRHAIVSEEQLDESCARHDDDYVRDLRPEQVDRFGVAIEAVLQLARDRGFPSSSVLCEVLSTWPAPLEAVMTRHRLGRFCVTQKALPHEPDDVYRSENTKPQDRIMVGNHDTQPLWSLVGTQTDTWRRDRAGLLALHMAGDAGEREDLQAKLAADKRAFCKAMFTELFLAPARNVSVFFTDLLGMRETYNQPGTVGPHNWTLRVPRDYARLYAKRCARGEAFDVEASLAAALRVRSCDVSEGDRIALADRLEQGGKV